MVKVYDVNWYSITSKAFRTRHKSSFDVACCPSWRWHTKDDKRLSASPGAKEQSLNFFQLAKQEWGATGAKTRNDAFIQVIHPDVIFRELASILDCHSSSFRESEKAIKVVFSVSKGLGAVDNTYYKSLSSSILVTFLNTVLVLWCTSVISVAVK